MARKQNRAFEEINMAAKQDNSTQAPPKESDVPRTNQQDTFTEEKATTSLDAREQGEEAQVLKVSIRRNYRKSEIKWYTVGKPRRVKQDITRS